MSTIPNWIELPTSIRFHQPSPEVTALRDCYLQAARIGHSLLCASLQAERCQSPDVKDCAGIVRDALHMPEKVRANALKEAEAKVLACQVDFVSTMIYYEQHKDAWRALRPNLVTLLEALTAPPATPGVGIAHFDIDLRLNCEAVVELLDNSDICINAVNQRLSSLSRQSEKLAKAGFLKVVEALTAEVSKNIRSAATYAVNPKHSTEMLRDIPVDKISSTDVPIEFEKCSALRAARTEFEKAINGSFTSVCRDFAQEAKGTINEPQMAEALLAAMPDVAEMTRLEARRDEKLRKYARTWRSIRSQVDAVNSLFVRTAELLPDALAEATAIEDETMRLKAQNLCLFTARRLKENLKFVRDCNRFVPEYEEDRHRSDIASAVVRNHQTLLERIQSKNLRHPTARVREQNHYECN